MGADPAKVRMAAVLRLQSNGSRASAISSDPRCGEIGSARPRRCRCESDLAALAADADGMLTAQAWWRKSFACWG